jgi:hypothetical protein
MPEAERRRVAKVIHDDRGNATVRWRDAPRDHERAVLEILDTPGLAIKADEAYDPYAKHRPPRHSSGKAPGGGTQRTRTDLRKLSEWIKQMRELEERKNKPDDED